MSTILIVDDESAVTKSIGNILSRMGFTTLVTENGNEALEMIKESKPQLVFLDVNINGLKGTEVLRQAKQLDPAIKIVMISGNIDEDMEQYALDNGALAFLRKPFAMQDIQKLLATTGLIQK